MLLLAKTASIRREFRFFADPDIKYTRCVCVQSCILHSLLIYASWVSLSPPAEGALLQPQLFLLELL